MALAHRLVSGMEGLSALPPIHTRPEIEVGHHKIGLMVHREPITISTSGHGDMHDLTDKVAAIVAASAIPDGTLNLFNLGSTASIGTIEFEPGWERDLPAILDKPIPTQPQLRARAGLARRQRPLAFAGDVARSLTVPVANGKPMLGTWQQIFHLECDLRGRQRTVVVTVMGE